MRSRSEDVEGVGGEAELLRHNRVDIDASEATEGMVHVLGAQGQAAAVDGQQRRRVDAEGLVAVGGAADDAVAADAGAHHHHAGDRPMILAVAIVVAGGATEIGADDDDDAIAHALTLGFDHEEVDAFEQPLQRRNLALVVSKPPRLRFAAT